MLDDAGTNVEPVTAPAEQPEADLPFSVFSDWCKSRNLLPQRFGLYHLGDCRSLGRVPIELAEEWADRMGVDPAQIWGEAANREEPPTDAPAAPLPAPVDGSTSPQSPSLSVVPASASSTVRMIDPYEAGRRAAAEIAPTDKTADMPVDKTAPETASEQVTASPPADMSADNEPSGPMPRPLPMGTRLPKPPPVKVRWDPKPPPKNPMPKGVAECPICHLPQLVKVGMRNHLRLGHHKDPEAYDWPGKPPAPLRLGHHKDPEAYDWPGKPPAPWRGPVAEQPASVRADHVGAVVAKELVEALTGDRTPVDRTVCPNCTAGKFKDKATRDYHVGRCSAGLLTQCPHCPQHTEPNGLASHIRAAHGTKTAPKVDPDVAHGLQPVGEPMHESAPIRSALAALALGISAVTDEKQAAWDRYTELDGQLSRLFAASEALGAIRQSDALAQ